MFRKLVDWFKSRFVKTEYVVATIDSEGRVSFSTRLDNVHDAYEWLAFFRKMRPEVVYQAKKIPSVNMRAGGVS